MEQVANRNCYFTKPIVLITTINKSFLVIKEYCGDFFTIAYLKKKTKMIHTAVFSENIWNLLPSIFRWPGSTSGCPDRVGTSWSSSFLGILGTHGLKSYPYDSRLQLGIYFRPLHHTKQGGFSQKHTVTTYSYHTHITNEPNRVHLY